MRWGLFLSAGLIVLAFFLVSTNISYYAGDSYWDTGKAGFLAGVVHGILAPLILIISIFTDYSMYELNNSGWFYNFGFLLGVLFVWGGGTKSTKNVVKNYYQVPSKSKRKLSMKLSEDDHKRIEKAVEKKVNKKVNEHEKEEQNRHDKEKKPREALLPRLFLKKKKKKKKR